MSSTKRSEDMNCRPEIEALAATFPAEFQLRGFPGERCRISVDSSYCREWYQPSTIVLYVERYFEGQWRDFVKGSPSDIQAQVKS